MTWTCNNEPVNIVTNGGYTLEQILENKHCSKDPSYWYPIDKTDRYLFKSSIAESWEFFDPLIDNPISNTNSIYLRMLNTSVFTETRDTFKENEYYCYAPEDTVAFNQFWDKEEDRVANGLEVDGVRISGRYYWWLNYGRLKATENKRKIERFADFIDHQYYWSLELEEVSLEGLYNEAATFLAYFPNKTAKEYRRLQKEGMIVSKSRRKGYSYFKASALHVYNFTWLESSMNILAAFEKGHYKVPLDAIHMGLNFLNKHTPWVRRRGKIDTRTNFRASIEVADEYGIKIEKGYMSEINCISFKDDPFKGIGDSVDYIDIEEAGKFSGLLETYAVSIEPLIRDGNIMIGIPLIGGTSGDMDKGSVDLHKMQSNPKGYGCKAYSNIYDSRPNEQVGYFIDDMWMMFGSIEKDTIRALYPDDFYLMELMDKYEGDDIECLDAQGNSHRRFAEIVIDIKRKEKKKGDIRAYTKFISQQPKTLDECYLVTEGSPFDIATIKEVLVRLRTEGENQDEPGQFIIDGEGKVQWRFDPTKEPIKEFPLPSKDTNKAGCWVIYNKPVKVNGVIPVWRYIGGCDPIDFGSDEVNSGNSHSLASTFIIDVITRNIVAEYTGRPEIAEQYYEQLWRGIEYYNAELLYENNLKGLFTYFRTHNKLQLLANQPESLKDRHGYKEDNRSKGFHATGPINSFARGTINTWSLEKMQVGQDEETGEIHTIPRMYGIRSIPLLQEMENWKVKGNYDRISSLGAAMILLQDREISIANVGKRTNERLEEKFFKRMNKFKHKR